MPLEKSVGSVGGAFVGAGIDEVRFYRKPHTTPLWAHATLRAGGVSANTVTGDVRVYDATGELVSETLGAKLWYLDAGLREQLAEPIESLFYEARWIADDRAAALRPPATLGTWLVLRDRQGVGDALCRQLRASGAECICVDYGARTGGDVGTDGDLVALSVDGLADVFARALTRASTLRGIVHLWSLDAADVDRCSVEEVLRATELGPISTIHLLQALEQRRPEVAPKLWLVTRGAQPADGSESALAALQSPLWGLGRTIAVEHGDYWGGLVDLDPLADADSAADALVASLRVSNGEDQVAFRNGRRLLLRLARFEHSSRPSPPVHVRRDGSYLITGGLGGIGLEVARWLAERGAGGVILTARHAVPPKERWGDPALDAVARRSIDAIRLVESRGTRVLTMSSDVSDQQSVAELVERSTGWSDLPLRGVFHAAGVMQYELLATQTSDRIRDVLAAKMVGGWLLHRMLAEVPLDLFVLFSSSSSLLSSPMMGGYSAANAFLDALAHHRRAGGKPALSINWGTWAETGMATRFQTAEEHKRHGRTGATRGVGALSTQRALGALDALLNRHADRAQAGVVPIDWAEWQRAYGSLANTPYVSLLVAPRASTPTAGAGSADAMHRVRIAETAPEGRPAALQEYLTLIAARILRVPGATVDTAVPISALGFDSLMSVELRNQIERDLGTSVPMASLIQGPSLAEVAELLAASFQSRQTAPVRGEQSDASWTLGAAEASELLTQLQDLGEADIDELLGKLLSGPPS
jgi:phthiocerol/phenolphthiocerol synthesis type-I polyketide synthase D